MKSIKSERGQALILIALAAIGLFAIAGLAIDGSAKFSDRRHAQNAADTAALAGALELAKERTNWDSTARTMAGKNGYLGDLVGSQLWVYFCDQRDVTSPVDCGPYKTSHNHIQVVITSNVNTYFARVIGIQQTHNTVQAVTQWSKAGPAYGPDVLKSLKNTACSGQSGNLVLGGNASITLNGGGAFINSPGGVGDCGIEQSGCPDITINNGSISTVGSGNVNIGACNTVIAPAPSYNSTPFQFPPEMPEEPAECTSPIGKYVSDLITHKTTLKPGKYYEFPPKSTPSQPIYDEVFMEPGIYCVEDVVKLSDKNLILTGYDVTIFIRSGYKFDIQGGRINLTASTSGPYAGYVIIVD